MISDYVRNYQTLKNTEFSWRKPVVGIASALDPLFLKLKEIISTTHALPSDLVPKAKSVIVFFLPFSQEVVASNLSGEESSREWDIANIETNCLIADINKYLFEKLLSMGYQSSLLPATYNYDEKKLISDWSHRHVAFIAGIGNFGIHNMLITDSGCCGRLGSIVTDLELEPSKRTNQEYCLFKHNGKCGKCMSTCVNEAFLCNDKKVLFNRQKCNEQIYDKIVPEYPNGMGDACGKCMCGMPCSLTNPVKGLESKIRQN